MQQTTKIIQKRYEGFLQTNCLWKSNSVYGLHAFEIEATSSKIDIIIDEKLRLGKYVERFVSYQLQQEYNISIICENIQIQREKITLGELDCIVLKDKKTIHLEIIYKFYLYDPLVGVTEIEHFIGPNRKDSLVDKLTKLKEKQLPLLYASECLNYLKTIDLDVDKIEQQVYFKAQLFVPLSEENIVLNELNQECVVGFYINKKELEQFKECKFFIPNKKDWLIIAHQNVAWIDFYRFKEKSSKYLEREFSPLCWMKKSNGEIKKLFLVWW
ncbi:DUF1853 family protein [Polaribacter glomeratus]|uniref:DUF1853 domain-containing protein n=1 Tax=Polaribacter glomeratus TaxID=102 RepID=A0A2S7WX64_9FLAO|nr:DUF1853 family protein [Polaribacter glomeratus]PQJ81971.1 hypothetical protein BTO16_05015 [Polaribacter glomeratus]TXD66565.1 DUF1853 family protein [Polaribacter glomeratus]